MNTAQVLTSIYTSALWEICDIERKLAIEIDLA